MSEALDRYLALLNEIATEAQAAFQSATDEASLEQARIAFLGAKSGRLKDAQKGLGTIDKSDKPEGGKAFNACKVAVETAQAEAQARIESAASQSTGPAFDPTLPGHRRKLGHLHPITQTIEELKNIAARLGFTIVDGPEIEDEWHNFEALNIPPEHPARAPDDNFYLNAMDSSGGSLLLRSQTSTVQIRIMETQQPPVRIVSLGRVYRPDPADATHYPMFHQVEGLLVDRGITMAHLKTTLRMFASALLGESVHIRFRPSFFPFTEPSVEVDMSFQGRWMEMGGAGMVDPNVLASVGYDPEQVSGFAFGLGVERITMKRFGLTDIRDLYKNDVRFLEQF
jgi:phenylalanyl-tRNA synthetase alpha chain